MSARVTAATAARVLSQLRRDPRTVVLLLGVPSVLVVLLKYVFSGNPAVFDRIGGPLLGLFPFITMFIVTSITMLRERTSGTLERLMSMPPALVFPQFLLCGLFVARADMARGLELASYAMPLTYAYDAIDLVTRHGEYGGAFARDVAVTAGATLAALVLGALTLRRRTQ